MLAMNVTAASSGELEQQPSQDQQPLLQQQPQDHAKGQGWSIKALSIVNESVSTGCAAVVCRLSFRIAGSTCMHTVSYTSLRGCTSPVCHLVTHVDRSCVLYVLPQTKWTVSATVFAVLLWQHNEYAAWCVVGAVFFAFLCKVRQLVQTTHYLHCS
jgi:hypothetical protein